MFDDPAAHKHAFANSLAKIDPKSVVNSVKDEQRAKTFKEVSIVDAKEAEGFTPMQWPLFDDGKPVGTNAMGYEVGGYFKRHQDALRMAQEEAARREEEERFRAERDAAEAAAEESKAEPTVSLEELEAIRNAARKEGYTEGMRAGHEEGYVKGVEQGKTDGFIQGQKEGMEQGYQDGFRQGRDEGFSKGQESGIATGSDMVTTQADRFRHLADMLANPIREIDEAVTDEIVYIISRLAKVVLKRELKGDIDFLKYGIEKSLSLLPEAKGGAEIVLSENDYALMVAAIGRDYMNEQGWNLVPSDTMEDGDILVNTNISSAQWRVNDRLDALINDFLVGAADAVAMAKKEIIDGAPDYDELPKKQLIPPRDILGMSERIAKNMNDMAPRPDFADEAAANLAAAMGQNGEADNQGTEHSFDPDAAELQSATIRDETDAALRATASAIDAGGNEVVDAQDVEVVDLNSNAVPQGQQ